MPPRWTRNISSTLLHDKCVHIKHVKCLLHEEYQGGLPVGSPRQWFHYSKAPEISFIIPKTQTLLQSHKNCKWCTKTMFFNRWMLELSYSGRRTIRFQLPGDMLTSGSNFLSLISYHLGIINVIFLNKTPQIAHSDIPQLTWTKI